MGIEVIVLRMRGCIGYGTALANFLNPPWVKQSPVVSGKAKYNYMLYYWYFGSANFAYLTIQWISIVRLSAHQRPKKQRTISPEILEKHRIQHVAAT